jgi:peptide chain release factor subunit 1
VLEGTGGLSAIPAFKYGPLVASSLGIEHWSDHQKYTFKRTIEDLGSYRGMGTELVTLYIPPTRQISDAAGMLRDELGQASNIKSKQTSTAVSSALTSMLAKLKNYKMTPENGIALFVGTVSTGSGNKTTQVSHAIEPPAPIPTYQYRCDSTFNVDPLKDMMASEEVYGLLIIDRKELSVGLLRGKSLVPVHNKHSLVPSKHGRGGQSQRRFERLTEEIADQWFKGSADKASEIFLNEPNLKAVIIGGPGATKDYFLDHGFLHHEIKKIVHPATFDTGYTDDDQGLKELVQAAEGAITGISMLEDKQLMQRFLKETGKMDGGLAEYGEGPVRAALDAGAVDHLLISEDMRKVRLTFTNNKTNEIQYTTVDDYKADLELDKRAKEWGGANTVEMVEKDLVEDLSDMAEAQGSNVHIVSPASEEGQILKNAFGGVVAILRFRT